MYNHFTDYREAFMKKKILLLTTLTATTLSLVVTFMVVGNTQTEGFAIQSSNSNYTAVIN